MVEPGCEPTSQLERSCTSPTLRSVLLIFRGWENSPVARPAAPGFAFKFLPSGSKGTTKCNWEEIKAPAPGSGKADSCWYLKQPIEMLCSFPVRAIWKRVLMRWAWFAPWHHLSIHIQWQLHRRNLGMTYLWDSWAPAELVLDLCSRFRQKKRGMYNLGMPFFL